MTYSSNSRGTNLIQGLSRAWRDYFAQSAELSTAYQASEKVIEQAYLDIMQDMMSVSLDTQRIFRRLNFRFHLLSDAQCFFVPGAIPGSGDRFVFAVDLADKGWRFTQINYIGNSLAAPTAFLERGVDFDFVTANSAPLKQLRGREPNLPFELDYISFYADPFQNALFTQRKQEESFANGVSRIGPSVNYTGLGVVTGDIIHITFDADGREFFLPITEIAPSILRFDTVFLEVIDEDTDRLSTRGFTFSVEDAIGTIKVPANKGRFISNTVETNNIPLWFSDCLVDDYGLSQVYGDLLGINETSSDNYKQLLRGLLQYYVRGRSISRANAAVNVIAGLPVFDSDGETVQSIDTTGPDTTILTDANLYFANTAYPISDDVLKNAASIDNNTPDDTARWVSFPKGIDLKLLGIDGSDSIFLSDGAGTGVGAVFPILKVYNNQRLLLQTGGQVTAGTGKYYGYSVGSNASFDDKISLETDRFVDVEAFTRDTSIEFEALDPITSTVSVVDYKIDPTWWEGKLLPELLFEEQEVRRRIAVPEYFPPKIGTPNVRIGDPMFRVGADEQNRNKLDQSVILEIPYFDKTLTALPNAKEFRLGERIYSYSGTGNGEGVLLYHNKVRDILYVQVRRGRFYQGDTIAGAGSNAVAKAAYRTRVKLSSNTGLPLSTYTATGGSSGTATGVVAYKIGEDALELYERPSARQVRQGDTIVVGGNSATVISVQEEDLAPSHRAFATYMADNIWKYGILQISYDFSSFEFARGLETLRGLIESGIESRVYVYIDPFTQFLEVIPPPDETLELFFSRIFSETVVGFSSQLTINGPSAANPDPWKIGESGYIIGGANPAYTVGNVAGFIGDAGYTDLAVDIQITV